MKQIFYTLAAILFIIESVSSCSQKEADLVLTDKVKDTATVLTPEPLAFDIPVTAQKIYIWNDSIAIINNRIGNDNHKFLEFYDVHRNLLLNDIFIKGNGPDEMLHCKITLLNDTILADDIFRQNFSTIPIKEALDSSFTTKLLSYNVTTPYFLPYKKCLLAVNPFYFSNKKYNIDNNAPRFIISDSLYTYRESKEYKYDTFNVSPACFTVSYEKNRIFFYSACEPLIEIYDTDLNLLKTISGPKLPRDIEYIALGKGLTFTNGVPYSYREHCRNSNYVYVAYNGDFSTENKKYDEMYDSWIFKFDWDGNFISSYFIDICILSMSLSSNGDSLYIFGLDREGHEVLNRYKLQ